MQALRRRHDIHAMKIEEHERVSIFGRKRPERTLNEPSLLVGLVPDSISRGSAGSAIASSVMVRGGILRTSVRIQVGGEGKQPCGESSLTAPFRQSSKRSDEGFLGHVFGSAAVVAEPRHVDERTLPASNDLPERGQISPQYAINGLCVVRRAHDLLDIRE